MFLQQKSSRVSRLHKLHSLSGYDSTIEDGEPTTGVEEGLEGDLVTESCRNEELFQLIILEQVTQGGHEQRNEVDIVDLQQATRHAHVSDQDTE